MKLLIPNQTGQGEARVAMVPAVLKRLQASGVEGLVESGAGKMAAHVDDAYTAAGAKIVGPEAWGEADKLFHDTQADGYFSTSSFTLVTPRS